MTGSGIRLGEMPRVSDELMSRGAFKKGKAKPPAGPTNTYGSPLRVSASQGFVAKRKGVKFEKSSLIKGPGRLG
jgi:hypothetical protein